MARAVRLSFKTNLCIKIIAKVFSNYTDLLSVQLEIGVFFQWAGRLAFFSSLQGSNLPTVETTQTFRLHEMPAEIIIPQ